MPGRLTKKKVSLTFARRSTSESIFLIQPMSIQPAPAKRCLGISLKQTRAAKPLSLRQRCTARCARNRMAAASPAKPSFTNWKIASAVYVGYQQAWRYVKIELQELQLSWQWDRHALRLATSRDGAYLLCTNLEGNDPAKLLDPIHPADRSRSRFPCPQKRSGHPAHLALHPKAGRSSPHGRIRFWCKFQKRSARGPGRPRGKGVTRLPNRA